MIQITLQDIRNIFDAVLNNEMKREDADRWAYRLIQEFDKGSLVFLPHIEEDRIWDAI